MLLIEGSMKKRKNNSSKKEKLRDKLIDERIKEETIKMKAMVEKLFLASVSKLKDYANRSFGKKLANAKTKKEKENAGEVFLLFFSKEVLSDALKEVKDYMDLRESYIVERDSGLKFKKMLNLIGFGLLSFREDAFNDPLIIDSLKRFRVVCDDRKIPQKDREFLKKLYRNTLGLLTRNETKNNEKILEQYENYFRKAKLILKKLYRNPAAKKLNLKDNFPDLNDSELIEYLYMKPSEFALEYTAKSFGYKPTYLKNILAKERKIQKTSR